MAAIVIVSTSTLTACDDQTDSPDVEGLVIASPDNLEPDADVVSFREPGPPSAIYVTQWGGKSINRAGFKSIIDSCTKYGDPKLTCTLSWYDPDTSVAGDQVVGLGCSMMASQALLTCYSGMFKQNGGKDL